MPRLVHLARSSARRGIERAGIRGSSGYLGLDRAVFAMPLLQDFATSYQWLRELRRWHGERMMAVHFALDSDERVLVGRYSEKHVELPLRDAIRRVIAKPAGAEIVVPRSIAKRDVLAFREVGQLVGWTEVPSGEPKWDCVCPACLGSGTPDFTKRVRAAFDRLALQARTATTDQARVAALRAMDVPLERARGRLSPKRLVSYARADSDDVRCAAALALAWFRWADVESALLRLLADPWPSVRDEAARSIVRSAGMRRAWPLLVDCDEDVQVGLVEQLVLDTKGPVAVAKLEVLAAKASRRVVRAIQREVPQLLRDDEMDAETRSRIEALLAL